MQKNLAIALDHVSFSFTKNGPLFFDNISVQFMPGSLNFIQGKNGVGKSTFLRIMCGQGAEYGYVSGKIIINDISYDVEKSNFAHHIACVGQNYNKMLIDNYSFIENVQCALMPRFPMLSQLPKIKTFPNFLKKYDINTGIAISQLSGGQRQILSIVMNLQRLPVILLLDEPIAALDEENTDMIMHFLKDLCEREKITIILIIHNFEVVKRYGNGKYFEIKKDDIGKRNIVLQSF